MLLPFRALHYMDASPRPARGSLHRRGACAHLPPYAGDQTGPIKSCSEAKYSIQLPNPNDPAPMKRRREKPADRNVLLCLVSCAPRSAPNARLQTDCKMPLSRFPDAISLECKRKGRQRNSRRFARNASESIKMPLASPAAPRALHTLYEKLFGWIV